MQTLSQILNIDYENTTYQERVKLRWDYIQLNKEVEHWDNIEYWEHHSKRKSDPELIYFDKEYISTHGRVCINGVISNGIRLGNYLGIVSRKALSKYQIYIHRSVCSTFVPNPDVTEELKYPDFDTNHMDRVKTNNHIENLEWLTPSQNCKHAWGEMGFRLNKNKVIRITSKLPGMYHGSIWYITAPKEAKALGFNDIALSQVLANGENHKGCTWQYIDPFDGIEYGIPEDALKFILNSKTNIGNSKPVVGTIFKKGPLFGQEFVLVGAEDVRRYGFVQANISKVCNGERPLAHKCRWRYVINPGDYQMGPNEEQLAFIKGERK